MTKPSQPSPGAMAKIESGLNLFLLVAAILFVVGISTKFAPKHSSPAKATSDQALHLIERQQAIEEAKKNGQTDYSYSTGFMPSLGGSGR